MEMSKIHDLANRHEKEIQQSIPNSFRTIASGSKHQKGDVATYDDGTDYQLFVEAKCTQNSSYRLGLELLKKVEEQSLCRGLSKRPVLAIRFYGPSENPLPTPHSISPSNVANLGDYLVVKKEDYLELLQKAFPDGQ